MATEVVEFYVEPSGNGEKAQERPHHARQGLVMAPEFRRLEDGIGPQGIEFDHFNRHLPTDVREHLLGRARPQDDGGVMRERGEGRRERGAERVAGIARQDQYVDEPDADDPERHFGRAVDRHAPDLVGRCDRSETDQRCREAGEREAVGCVVAGECRSIGAEGEPQRHGQDEERSRLREEADAEHGKDGAAHRANQTKRALGPDGADQRLGEEVGGEHRPLRILQPPANRRSPAQGSLRQKSSARRPDPRACPPGAE